MDNVNHPSHYNQGKIEVIEYIEDQQLGYHLGNAVKYISRAGKKNPEASIEDLEKAIWYIKRQIEVLKPNPRRPNDMVDPDQMTFELTGKQLQEWSDQVIDSQKIYESNKSKGR